MKPNEFFITTSFLSYRLCRFFNGSNILNGINWDGFNLWSLDKLNLIQLQIFASFSFCNSLLIRRFIFGFLYLKFGRLYILVYHRLSTIVKVQVVALDVHWLSCWVTYCHCSGGTLSVLEKGSWAGLCWAILSLFKILSFSILLWWVVALWILHVASIWWSWALFPVKRSWSSWLSFDLNPFLVLDDSCDLTIFFFDSFIDIHWHVVTRLRVRHLTTLEGTSYNLMGLNVFS